MPSADRRRTAIYSRDLGLDLAPGRERELFRWLLACLLFGKPIEAEEKLWEAFVNLYSEASVVRTGIRQVAEER